MPALVQRPITICGHVARDVVKRQCSFHRSHSSSPTSAGGVRQSVIAPSMKTQSSGTRAHELRQLFSSSILSLKIRTRVLSAKINFQFRRCLRLRFQRVCDLVETDDVARSRLCRHFTAATSGAQLSWRDFEICRRKLLRIISQNFAGTQVIFVHLARRRLSSAQVLRDPSRLC